jgi:hypothetical protein
MDSKMLRWLLIANSLAVGFFTIFLLHAVLLGSLSGPIAVTALDRKGVIDEAKLKAEFPELWSNYRHTLGMWITRHDRAAGLFAVAAGAGLAVANIVLAVLGRRRHRTRGTTSTG